jgi:N-acetylglucosaminyldiphosphoundecaprenol N-acetyl-beta-D-mannosaminyltransferase
VRLLASWVHCVTTKQTLDHIAQSCKAGVGGWVLTPNLDILRKLHAEPEFAKLCEGTTLRTADGMPLVWASKLQRTPLPERVAGSDLIHSLSARAEQEGLSIFLLGGNPGVAEEAAKVLQARHPKLRIAGTACPPFGFEKDPTYVPSLLPILHASKPDIVFVALGAPKQELLICDLRPHMPAAWFLGIGISFSFVTGQVERAPKLLQNLGLEWMHRLVQEPKRLCKRYLVDGIPFAIRLLSVSAMRGMGMKK